MDHMGRGSQMLFNPAFGDDIYHAHPAGMWMVNYKFMHMAMDGLRDGTRNVPVDKVSPVGSKPYGYMMTPTNMTMDMQMLMVMYGLTDRLTLRYGVGVFEPSNTIGLRYRLTKRLFLEAASGLASSLDLFYRRDF